MSFGRKEEPQRQASPMKPPFNPTRADTSVLLAGLMGMRPKRSPALSSAFTPQGISSGGLSRHSYLGKRQALGGA